MSAAPSQPPPNTPPAVTRHDDVRATVSLADIDKTPLAGAGNYLYRFQVGEHDCVLKIYEGSRSPLLYWKKTFGNVVLTGRSSHMPAPRCRIEVDCVRTWSGHGFRCFGLYPNIEIPELSRDVYMVYEYVGGRHFREYFKDQSIPLEERMDLWRRWIPEWHRRHAIAVETNDNRLIHENGDVKHVMLHEGDFVYFDFEMIYTSGNLHMLVGREILAYMRSVGRFFGDEMYDRMLSILIETYPDKALLMSSWEFAFRNASLFMRGARWLDRTLKPSNKRKYSKYQVARDIKGRLDAASLA